MSPDIDEALKFLEKHKPGYGYYYDDRYKLSRESIRKQLINNALNCSDEIVPGSQERSKRIIELTHKKILIGSENFMEQYSEIVYELHELIKAEVMLLNRWSEQKANQWIDVYVDFNHVKETTDTKGNKYLSVDPKFGYKY